MNKYHILSLICFITAIILFTVGYQTGEVEGGIIVIFPFILGSGVYGFFGVILFFLTFIFFMFGFISSVDSYREDQGISETKTSIKGGGVVLIGPIPIVFGSNWKIALVLLVFIIIIMIISILFLFSNLIN